MHKHVNRNVDEQIYTCTMYNIYYIFIVIISFRFVGVRANINYNIYYIFIVIISFSFVGVRANINYNIYGLE